MAYKKTFKRVSSGDSSAAAVFDLGKKKQVTVRKYNNVNLVDIREFYVDKATGENRPGKKGISLTEDSWKILIENIDNIQEALDLLAGRATEQPSKKRKLESEKPAKVAIQVDDDDGDDDESDIKVHELSVEDEEADLEQIEKELNGLDN